MGNQEKDLTGADDAPIEEPLAPSEGEVDASIPQGTIASDGGDDAAEGAAEGGE